MLPSPITPAPEPTTAVEAATLAMDQALAEPEAPAVEEAPPEPLLAEEAAPELVKPEPEKAPVEPAVKPEPEKAADPKDTSTEKEITDLKLKDRAAERFRELSASKAEYEPLKAVLASAGVKDAEGLKAIVKQAEDAHFIVQQVQATGASPEQYVKTMDYLNAVNAMGRGDMKAAEVVYESLVNELTTVATLLGRDIPGIVDPLKAYPDLTADVENEKITRERALELARNRTGESVRASNADAAAKVEQANSQKLRAIEAGTTALDALPQKLAARDPGGVGAFQAKYPALLEKTKAIVKEFPPEQWEYQVALAYLSLPTPEPAKPKPAPYRGTGTPLGSGGPTPVLTPQSFADPMAALEAGLDAANQGA